MNVTNSIFRREGQKLKRLANKGKLTQAALSASGLAVMAAFEAQADHLTPGATFGTTVIGQSLVGATHTHQNGMTHSHGPLSANPNGIQHSHNLGGQGQHASFQQSYFQNQVVPQQISQVVAQPQVQYLPQQAAYYGGGQVLAGQAGGGMGALTAMGLGGLAGLAALFFFGEESNASLVTINPTPYLGTGGTTSSTSTRSSNSAPQITSSNAISVDEGETGTFSVVSATDNEGGTLSFSIIGGDDAGLFSINTSTGAISYRNADGPQAGDASDSDPDFSALDGDEDNTSPLNGNNTLEVRVQVADPQGNTAAQTITYFIQNETVDDVVEDYLEADDIDRLDDDETNSLVDMDASEVGQDDNGDVLVVSVDGSDTVTVTELEGDGDINTSTFGTNNFDYFDVAVADIDGDGDLDVALAGRDDSGDNIVEIWESNGNGSFSLEYTATDGSASNELDEVGTARDVLIGDFNGSGDLDVFLINDGGEDSLITLSGNYSGSIDTNAGLDLAEEGAILRENEVGGSNDLIVGIESGDIALVDPDDDTLEDQVSGSYDHLAVIEDMVFASEGSSVDVFEADTNSLDLETNNIISGLNNITDLAVGDFDDDDSDLELAVLDGGDDEVRIYDIDSGFDDADLLFTIDVDSGANELTTIEEAFEQLGASGGNLADDLLVGGNNSTVFYDATSL